MQSVAAPDVMSSTDPLAEPEILVERLFDAAQCHPELSNYNLERVPADGTGYSVQFHGWVIGRLRGATSVCVQITDGPMLFHSALHDRADVAEHFIDHLGALRSGFRVLVNLLTLPDDVTLSLHVCGVGGVPYAELCRVRIKSRFPRVDVAGGLRPVLVCSQGRSGSTALMRGLARHPEIAVHNKHPYEMQYFQYCAHSARVHTSGQHSPLAPYSEKFYLEQTTTGECPYVGRFKDLNNWVTAEQVPTTLRHWFGLADNFYGAIAQRERKHDVRFFAEKSVVENGEIQLMRNVGVAPKVVLLLRDPRDVAASWLKFLRRDPKAALSVDLEEFGQHIDHLGELFGRMNRFAELHASDILVVKYEEMMTDAATVAERILRYCEADAGEEAIRAVAEGLVHEDEALRGHRTTASLEASFGSWRKDLLDWQQDICHKRLTPVAQLFGYI